VCRKCGRPYSSKEVVELARRNPENLHETIVGVNEAKKRVRRPPSLIQIKNWIEQAKTLERKVEY
jgi:biotin synthase-related radical SAM superfamily protein